MMLKRLTISLLAVAGMLGVVSCVNEPFAECPVVPVEDDARMVNLTFSVVAPSTTASSTSRAGVVTNPDEYNYFQKAEAFESIHTLRIIIVRPDDEVEHNKLFILSDQGVVRYDDMTFKVTTGHNGVGEKKRIYIIANEEIVPFDFTTISGTYIPGTIEDITLKADNNGVLIDNTGNKKTWIPICEVHEAFVKAPTSPELEEQTVGPFYITRAAVKFDISVTATNAGWETDVFDDYFVTGFTFYNVANQEYLLPRAKYSDEISNGEITPSKENPNPVTPLPDLFGRFITSYEIPDGTTHSQIQLPGDLDTKIPRLSTEYIDFKASLYFCERKFNSAAPNPYSLSMTVAQKDADGNIDPETIHTFDPVALPNLPILPRNTVVKINARIWRDPLTMTVELVPYIGVTLKPTFGF
ncbi:MAG: hypothetical protein K2G40_02435 [Muribaculaceae bacterium]|nr:hypothetical protein [Muribaculaceae bacterium]